jgi:hypothetical protein
MGDLELVFPIYDQGTMDWRLCLDALLHSGDMTSL